ncbi:MAG: hypothetical protein Q4G48_07955 [Bacteroidia bacterium]|nr:hypothetical protein [Bacteroidia bacterium]
MRKRLLALYDKIVIAAILGLLAFFGCARKNYPEKEREQEELRKKTEDSIRSLDSTILIPPGKFDNNPIAMYGVRPTQK